MALFSYMKDFIHVYSNNFCGAKHAFTLRSGPKSGTIGQPFENDPSLTMTSIKDVALHAGVSVATVSRALGNGPVSAALRERVEAAIAATGYHPNLSARRLRSQHTRTVGLVVSDIRNPFFTAVSRAVEEAAYQADMRVILCNTDENPEREALYLRLMQEERVSGMIYAPTSTMSNRLPANGFGFPTVLIDRCPEDCSYDAVVLDNHDAASQLVQHLLAQGYRHIGGLFGNTSTTGAQRHAGFAETLAAAGLPAPTRFIAPRTEAAESATRDWLVSGQHPQALLASNGQILAGMVRALRNLRTQIPHELAVVGFDNEPWTELVGPGLTVIEQPVDEIGQTAMDLLFERMKTPTRPARRIVLQGRCIVRGSSITR